MKGNKVALVGTVFCPVFTGLPLGQEADVPEEGEVPVVVVGVRKSVSALLLTILWGTGNSNQVFGRLFR